MLSYLNFNCLIGTETEAIYAQACYGSSKGIM